MPLRIYNSLTKQKEDFKPLKEDVVRMYVCGPTVYDLSHIGHARSAVAFDVVYRYLRYKGYKVIYTRNYTDIDDKIINRANQEGASTDEIAERYIKAYDEDMSTLGVELPTYRPRATKTIPDMTNLIQTLINKGYAYIVDGDVYYSVRRFRGYGKLSGKDIEELEAGARVEVDERKKDPLDFALWKKSKPGEPWWESPWGKGRPGWHIECSAMSQRFLGETLDIHGGGKDLIFPHHENEIAQSEAATGRPFVRYWLHNGFVNIEKEKMSKSLGNILTIRDAVRNYSAEAVRLFLLSSHYRSPIDYTTDALREAEAALERYYMTLERMEREWPDVVRGDTSKEEKKNHLQPFINAMDDDFNTSAVIGFIFERVNEANRLMDNTKRYGVDDEFKKYLPLIRTTFKEVGSFLGIFHGSPEEHFDEKKGRLRIAEDEIARLIQERDEARRNKNWKRADDIRAELYKRGVLLEDTPKGTVWRVNPAP
ncbi:MAG: cysteine--tRNA ligase [Deltaproteobacteria bacterium]|nr:cysteine--tRNA ligase [Deltaproteobacteria bacterium]